MSTNIVPMVEPVARQVPREAMEGLYEIRDRFVVDIGTLLTDEENRNRVRGRRP